VRVDRLHGMVSLEVYGRLSGQTPEPARVYRSEVRNLVATLGLRAISGT
jgi:hypothetical protein